MSAAGTWAIEIATPMGTQKFDIDLNDDGTGTAAGAGGTSDLFDGVVDGDTATFKTKVTSPFPLTLSFALTADGDQLSGESKAGSFPASKVVGTRR